MTNAERSASPRSPSDDSSSVVLHARHATFVMLITSIVVGVGILTDNIEQLGHAIKQSDDIRSLMTSFKDEKTSHLTNKISNHSSNIEMYNIQFSSESGAQKKCTLHFDRQRRFFLSQSGIPWDALVKKNVLFESGYQITLEAPEFLRNYLISVNKIPDSIPHGIRDFSIFWNMLVSNNRNATMDVGENATAAINRGMLIYGSSVLSSDFTTTLASSETDGGEINERIFVLPSTDFHYLSLDWSIMERSRWSNISSDDESERAPLHLKSAFKEINNMVWKLLTLNLIFTDDYIAVVPCYEDDSINGQQLLVAFPVSMKLEENFNWIDTWIERTGMVDIEQGEYSFREMFPELYLETQNWGNFDLKELSEQLHTQLETGGSRVDFWGVSISGQQLRTFGLLLILLVQAYAYRHLYEAAERIRKSTRGDPGAFQPWIFIYSGFWSCWASHSMVIAPAMAGLGILSTIREPGSGFVVVLSVLGWIVCLTLSIFSIGSIVRLRNAAQRHRNTSA